MSHRSTSIISALGLSAVLLGASPASATSQRIEVEKTVDGNSVVVSPRMAERGYEVRPAVRDTPVKDDCSLSAPCGARARDATTQRVTPEGQVWAYTEDGTGRQVRVVPRNTPIAW